MDKCEICFGTLDSKRLPLPPLKTGNGDVLRAGDCGHHICRTCMGRYVATRVEEQRVFDIRCPSVGCKNELYEKDLRRLVDCGALSHEICDRFVDLRARNYTTRAMAFSEESAQTVEDFALLRHLWNATRLCPRCSVVIEKSHGCNSFYCICGHHFDYSSAPRAIGNGMKKYSRVIDLAERCQMSIKEAEALMGKTKLFFKSIRIADTLGMTLEMAVDLQRQAKDGDEAARERIRAARKAIHAMA
mmetsp:Transcript_124569/g.265651  ORF Transcript_124569/g.265651 Transcript_124569/m.265651 type:complete len:245 (+) Transcript_124569:97-831(+)